MVQAADRGHHSLSLYKSNAENKKGGKNYENSIINRWQ